MSDKNVWLKMNYMHLQANSRRPLCYAYSFLKEKQTDFNEWHLWTLLDEKSVKQWSSVGSFAEQCISAFSSLSLASTALIYSFQSTKSMENLQSAERHSFLEWYKETCFDYVVPLRCLRTRFFCMQGAINFYYQSNRSQCK